MMMACFKNHMLVVKKEIGKEKDRIKVMRASRLALHPPTQ